MRKGDRVWTIELNKHVAELLDRNFSMVRLPVPDNKRDPLFTAWGYRTRAARELALVDIARLLPAVWDKGDNAPTLGLNSYWL
jgi:hypothetical protein